MCNNKNGLQYNFFTISSYWKMESDMKLIVLLNHLVPPIPSSCFYFAYNVCNFFLPLVMLILVFPLGGIMTIFFSVKCGHIRYVDSACIFVSFLKYYSSIT